MTLIVEFVGLSGAGKSTVADAVMARLRGHGFTCAHRRMIGGQELPRAEHYRRLASYFLRHPDLIRGSVRLSRSATGFTPFGLGEALRFYVWTYRLGVGCRLAPDFVILDQGVIQEGWSLVVRETGLDVGAILTAIKHMLTVTHVVYVPIYFQVSNALAAHRIARRTGGESRFDTINEAKAAHLLQTYEPVLRGLYEGAVHELQLPQIRIDGSRAIEELVEELVDFIRKLPVRSPPGTFVSR